jgi:hypothetical protein
LPVIKTKPRRKSTGFVSGLRRPKAPVFLSVFERSGHRFASRKRVKTKNWSPVLIQSEPTKLELNSPVMAVMVVPVAAMPVMAVPMMIAADSARAVIGQDNPAARVIITIIVGRSVIVATAVEMVPMREAEAATMEARMAVKPTAVKSSTVETAAMKRHAATVKATSVETSAMEASPMKTASTAMETTTAAVETAATTMTATATVASSATANFDRSAIRNCFRDRHRCRIDRRQRLRALTGGG